MAKSIRLLNVDVIMNTAGQVIAGEEVNTHAADGHSPTADSVLSTAGWGAANAPEMTAISEGSTWGSWGVIGSNFGYGTASASDGDICLSAGGYSGSSHASVNLKKFTDSSISNDTYGSLVVAMSTHGGCSNGTIALFMGGGNSGGNLTNIDAMNISSGGAAAGHGVIAALAKDGVSAGSNGTYAMMVGGATRPDNIFRDSNELISFDSPVTNTDWGSLQAGYGQGVSSNADHLMAAGRSTGSNTGAGVHGEITLKSYSDKSSVASFGNLSGAKYGVQGAGDGDTVLFLGGYNGGNKAETERKKFSDQSYMVDHDALTAARHWSAAASGNA